VKNRVASEKCFDHFRTFDTKFALPVKNRAISVFLSAEEARPVKTGGMTRNFIIFCTVKKSTEFLPDLCCLILLPADEKFHPAWDFPKFSIC